MRLLTGIAASKRMGSRWGHAPAEDGGNEHGGDNGRGGGEEARHHRESRHWAVRHARKVCGR